MRKGLRVYFGPFFDGDAFKVSEEMYERLFSYRTGPYIGPKEMFERVAPGHKRRQNRKDALRKADWEKVEEIVSGIFHKKQIRYPPSTLRDLNWIKDRPLD
ncbi:hypothetical protein SteCoe_28882 [Stentor coeruleus]|uniref:Uncharacterized protein n=1 Tax=Stentor coeruleus TaxID=5963 RepID=A0A1R2B789_9CILI|nr:hypothetical protein SteCoe_28882 [Stentor coeruleus]